MALLPSNPAPISQYWIDRGLELVLLGSGLIWTRDRGWLVPSSMTGGPKPRADKHGIVMGYGATFGTGTTDRILGPKMKTPLGFRSLVSHLYIKSLGGGNLGRVFQARGQTAIQLGAESFYVGATGGRLATYVHSTLTSTNGAWYHPVTGNDYNQWISLGLTHDCRTTGLSPVNYRDGALTTTVVANTASGTYTEVEWDLDFGNRYDGIRCFDGMHGPLYLFQHPDQGLTAKEHADLARDPSLIFDQRRRILFGAPAASGAVTATPTGVSATGAVGTVTAVTSALVEPTTVTATGAVGTVTAVTSALVEPTTVGATGAVGTVTVVASTLAEPTTVAATGAVGTVTAVTSALVEPTTVGATGAVGTVTVSVAASIDAPVTTVAGTGAVGTVTVEENTGAAVTTVAGTGAVGTVTAVTSALVEPTGLGATASLGSATATTADDGVVTGVAATATLGTVTAYGAVIALPSGRVGQGQVGSVVVLLGGTLTVLPTGVSATVSAGSLSTDIGWSVTPEDVTVTWTPVDDSASTSWSAVDDSETAGWTPVPLS